MRWDVGCVHTRARRFDTSSAFLIIVAFDVGLIAVCRLTSFLGLYLRTHLGDFTEPRLAGARKRSYGMMFTDYYAENSCTAGRSTFITGQSALRTGLSK